MKCKVVTLILIFIGFFMFTRTKAADVSSSSCKNSSKNYFKYHFRSISFLKELNVQLIKIHWPM